MDAELAELFTQVEYHLEVLRQRAHMPSKRALVVTLLRSARNELAMYRPTIEGCRTAISDAVSYVFDSSDSPSMRTAVERVVGDSMLRVPKGPNKDRLLSEALLESVAAMNHLEAAVGFLERGQKGWCLAACDDACVAIGIAPKIAERRRKERKGGDEPPGAERHRKALERAARRAVDASALANR